MKIGQQVEHARSPHSQPAARIQAEEKNSGLAAMFDVGPAVQLRTAQPQRQSSWLECEVKWSHTEPRLAVKRLQLQWRGDQRPQLFHRQRPVRKEKVVPALH